MDEVVEALRELVACKDMKDRIDAAHGKPVTHELANLAADYECRKPWAWKAARKALAGSVESPQPSYWLIYYEDRDRDLEMFTEEQAARKRYEQISQGWNAHLFARVHCNFARGEAPVESPQRAEGEKQNGDTTALPINASCESLPYEPTIPMMDAALQAIRAAKHVNAKALVPQGYEYHAACVIWKAMLGALATGTAAEPVVQNESTQKSPQRSDRDGVIEECAVAAWNRAMDMCKEQRVNPSERNDWFRVIGAIRSLKSQRSDGIKET